MKKIKASLLFFIFVMIIVFMTYHYKKHSVDKSIPDPVIVSTYRVTEKNSKPTWQTIGNVRAYKSIFISSEQSGVVTNVYFESGHYVKEGALLFNLNANAILATLAKAQLTLQDDLKQYERRKKLFSSHFISEAELEHMQSVVAKDQQDLKQQQAVLAQYRIKAPFSGVLGLSQIEKGQHIVAGQQLINLEALDEVYVDFSISEKWINRIKQNGLIDIYSDAYPDTKFKGTIVATSNMINIDNRSLSVRAKVPNHSHKLLSGMAVKVILPKNKSSGVIIPQSALTYRADGVGVYLVNHDNFIHFKIITLGERRKNEVDVISGLNLNDHIVIAGQEKCRDNISVEINNQDLIVD